jgi:methylaspartate ammonia-lyase
MTVQYAGAGGREPPFDPGDARRQVEQVVMPRLVGRALGTFPGDCRDVLAPPDGGSPRP